MSAVVVRVGTGARLWRSDGIGGRVAAISELGVFAVVDGERSPVVVNPKFWRLAFTCDYCDQAAELQLIGGQPGDVLCKVCARGQFSRVRDWVRPIPRTVVRQLWAGCRALG